MTRERFLFLMQNIDESLTAAEVKAGWHFCHSWGRLLIHEGDGEYRY